MDTKRRDLVRTTYDALACEYAGHLSDELAGKPLDRELLDRFADATRGKGDVWEVGCGPGHVARYLHERGVAASGVDLSPAMIGEARRLHPAVPFRVGDMMALDAKDASLAGVVSFYAIVHLGRDALPAAFRELRRVLSPGGRALLAFHVGDEILRPPELWGVPVALDWIFLQTLDVTSALTAAGLEVAGVVERDPYPEIEHASRRAYVEAVAP